MVAEPTGLFRHGGPADRSMVDMFGSLGLDDGAPILRAVFQAERPRLADIFRARHTWPALFRDFALFPAADCDRAVAEYLDWRADILYWKAIARIYRAELADRVVWRGLDNFRAAAGADGRLVLTPFHLRQFPLLPPALRSLGVRYTVVVSVNGPNDVTVDPAPGQPVVVLDATDPLVLVKAHLGLRDGRSLLVYPDLHRGGRPPRIPVSFLGRQLMSGSSWHLFCLNEQIPALPCYATGGPGNSIEITFGELLAPPATEEEAEGLVRDVYRFYEEPVRATLMQWEGWAEADWAPAAAESQRV
jgi:hypothetical protein